MTREAKAITVNGERHALEDADLAALLLRLGYGPTPRGLAVARNGRIVPRGGWPAEQLRPGDVLEIVGAVQGG